MGGVFLTMPLVRPILAVNLLIVSSLNTWHFHVERLDYLGTETVRLHFVKACNNVHLIDIYVHMGILRRITCSL